jgi:hypothetical protein
MSGAAGCPLGSESFASRIRNATMFHDLPGGFTVYREFPALRVTVSKDGNRCAIQFAKGKQTPECANILIEEGYVLYGGQWQREDERRPRWNLAETIKLARELNAYLHNKHWPPRGR